MLEANLKAYFEDKRMLSQIVEVEDVDYVPIWSPRRSRSRATTCREDVVARCGRPRRPLLGFDA